MSTPLSYLDLVVKTVRGISPVPEHQGLSSHRTELAKAHMARLEGLRHAPEMDTDLIASVLEAGPEFLCFLWDKMSPPALSMCGDKSIQQLLEAMSAIHEEQIPGDFIEAGVWRGGLPVIMRAFLYSVADKTRKVWLADSFRGLPEETTDPRDRTAHLLLEPLAHLKSQREVAENALRFFGLLDEQVGILEGWFSETLREAPSGPLSLIRLDGDYYESTRDAIEALYPRLSLGGYLIVDDYNLPLGCAKAIDEYRARHQILSPLIEINTQAVYWRKTDLDRGSLK